jgi:outer membrane translocation and assembly module TamA
VLRTFYILIFLLSSNLFAQNTRLIIYKDVSTLKMKSKLVYKNERDAQDYLTSLQQLMIRQGYLEASVDSTRRSKDTLSAWLHVGKKYSIKSPVISVQKRKRKAAPSTVYDVDITKEQLIRNFENNGYPFAKVRSDSIVLSDSMLSFKYDIDKGKLITIDSFVNHGSSKLTKGFIQNYVLIKSKQPYNESRIRKLDERLQKLPYASIRQPSAIYFRDDKADIHLFLDKRKVNSFDFLIGFLPGSNNKKILITGEVRLHLQNSFKRGEEIYLEWQKLQRQSQLLDVRFNYPYLLNAPIGVNFTFNLDKRDSSSLDLAWQLGLPYITSSNNYIKGFYKYFQTIVLVADTTFVKFNRKLPNNLDATYNQYGIQAYYETLDYLFNPQKGYELKLTGSIGTKKIKANSQITSLTDPFLPDYNYSTLYDSIKKKSLKGDIFWMGNYYLPLGKKQRHIFKFGLNGGSVFNQSLLKNELLRIGGNKILRGFDDQSIFASTYNVATVEYRMMLQKNSYFFVFVDGAYVYRDFNGSKFQDFPFGFGAGMTFETKIGIFGLTYALGQQKDQKIDFRRSKLHFGYVAVF